MKQRWTRVAAAARNSAAEAGYGFTGMWRQRSSFVMAHTIGQVERQPSRAQSCAPTMPACLQTLSPWTCIMERIGQASATSHGLFDAARA